MTSYRNKTVYITGGSSGIGLALARQLAALDADILLIARSAGKLGQAKKAVEKSGKGKVSTLSLDVADHGRVYEKMAKAADDFGPPDILILSAGINTAADQFENISHGMFNEIMDINVNGVRNVIHALFHPMKQKKSHVVILSSAAALFGMFGYTAYATSKAALMGFADSLRYELAPLGMPVTIVFPPDVDTPMNDAEAKTLPPQGRAMKAVAGLLTPEFTARQILKAIARKTYFFIPGRQTKFLYFLHRISNGVLTRHISDGLIRRAERKLK